MAIKTELIIAFFIGQLFMVVQMHYFYPRLFEWIDKRKKEKEVRT